MDPRAPFSEIFDHRRRCRQVSASGGLRLSRPSLHPKLDGTTSVQDGCTRHGCRLSSTFLSGGSGIRYTHSYGCINSTNQFRCTCWGYIRVRCRCSDIDRPRCCRVSRSTGAVGSTGAGLASPRTAVGILESIRSPFQSSSSRLENRPSLQQPHPLGCTSLSPPSRRSRLHVF